MEGRNLIFVSHANPEDNQVSLWLSLQLAREGYRVWCDLTRLLGGEDFWSNIEDALRHEAVKLVYVLSSVSNQKPGPLQELQVGIATARANGLEDFVIPVRVDDMAFGDINIQLARLNAIDFNRGWSHGLKALLEKLELDGVDKDSRFSPNSVASWWRTIGDASTEVIDSPEVYLSNWFPIIGLPDSIYLHSITTSRHRQSSSWRFSYPTRQQKNLLVSFASSDDLLDDLRGGEKIQTTQKISLDGFLEGPVRRTGFKTQEAHNIVVDLMRQGWERFIESAGLLKHHMSNRSVTGFLCEGQISRNQVSVPSEYGVSRRRTIVGYRTLKDAQGNRTRRRYWHFAIEARPALGAFVGYQIIPHLLFSDDGRKIWEGKDRLHRTRRRESRNWWNPQWRDRTLGLVKWLAGDNPCVEIPLGSQAVIQMETQPVNFTSPVSYADPATNGISSPYSVDSFAEVDPEEDSD